LLAIFGGYIAWLWRDQTRTTYARSDQIHEITAKDRANLLEQVRFYHIENILESSLHEAVIHDLKIEHKARDLQNKLGVILRDKKDEILNTDEQIAATFDNAEGRLLITAEPGGGKTTVMLRIARHRIAQALQNSDFPIPVVFNLSEWTEKQQSISEWIVDRLQNRYYMSKEAATQLVKTYKILPLLDGLDEVPVEHRPACLSAINKFRYDNPIVKLVVCCRRTEYNDLVAQNPDNRLDLGGSIEIQPLTIDQIENYLADVGDDAVDLRRAINDDHTLLELATTPLFLHVMALAYLNKPIKKYLASQPKTEEFIYGPLIFRIALAK
jgi:predicted NACHT family NTPase